MSKVVYTAEAHVTGGRAEGHGRSSDGALEVDLRTPTEMGGDGGGTNPEQLFAVGYAACFEGASAAARGAEGRGRRRRDRLRVDLTPDGNGGFVLWVVLARDAALGISEPTLRSSWSAPPTRSARIPTPPAATSRSR